MVLRPDWVTMVHNCNRRWRQGSLLSIYAAQRADPARAFGEPGRKIRQRLGWIRPLAMRASWSLLRCSCLLFVAHVAIVLVISSGVHVVIFFHSVIIRGRLLILLHIGVETRLVVQIARPPGFRCWLPSSSRFCFSDVGCWLPATTGNGTLHETLLLRQCRSGRLHAPTWNPKLMNELTERRGHNRHQDEPGALRSWFFQDRVVLTSIS